MDLGILEWQNEHALTDYPLSSYTGFNDFIVDAAFIQFDNFIPVLQKVVVTSSEITVYILFDCGVKTCSITKDYFDTCYKFYDKDRYLGFVVFGRGIYSLFDTAVGKEFVWNIPFAASTVTIVNSKAGVFSLEGLTGDILVHTGETSITRSIFFEISRELNEITWNAVALKAFPDEDIIALKTINNVPAVNNEIFLKGSDIIRFVPFESGLKVVLASESAPNVLHADKYGE